MNRIILIVYIPTEWDTLNIIIVLCIHSKCKLMFGTVPSVTDEVQLPVFEKEWTFSFCKILTFSDILLEFTSQRPREYIKPAIPVSYESTI